MSNPQHSTDSSGSTLRRQGLLFLLVGPAGSGKTTFARELVDKAAPGLTRAVSMTSRPPRPGERDGESYYFVSREEFTRKISRGELFEWEEVHGNLYGQLNATLRGAIEKGADLLLDIDIKGALNVKRAFPRNVVIAFIAPPSFEVLRARILARGAVSDEELSRRFQTAASEYQKLLSCIDNGAIDYLVVNDSRERTALELMSILTAERDRLTRFDAEAVARLCSMPG